MVVSLEPFQLDTMKQCVDWEGGIVGKLKSFILFSFFVSLAQVHFFNSFFYDKLRTKGYDGVKRWTKNVDIFNKELLLIPIHLEVDWSLISVDVRQHTITYFDSQRTLNRRCPKV